MSLDRRDYVLATIGVILAVAVVAVLVWAALSAIDRVDAGEPAPDDKSIEKTCTDAATYKAGADGDAAYDKAYKRCVSAAGHTSQP